MERKILEEGLEERWEAFSKGDLKQTRKAIGKIYGAIRRHRITQEDEKSVREITHKTLKAHE